MQLSDIASIHGYGSAEVLAAQLSGLQSYGRPILCTEWLHRQSGNTVQSVLPVWAEHAVGWYVWGLVAGRTQTYYHWGSAPGSPPPRVWQHDLLHPDGSPYDSEEVRHIQAWGNRRKP